MLCMNIIRNTRITTKDINLDQKTFGPDLGPIQGKMTKMRPLQAQIKTIEIPSELAKNSEEVVLSIDSLTVNSLKFLTTISHDLFYRAGQYLADATAQHYGECMKEFYGVYNQDGFTICDSL